MTDNMAEQSSADKLAWRYLHKRFCNRVDTKCGMLALVFLCSYPDRKAFQKGLLSVTIMSSCYFKFLV